MKESRHFPIPGLTWKQLAAVLAQVVDFGRDTYSHGDSSVEEITGLLSYICACFLAQHTTRGEDGVDAEYPYHALGIDRDMPYKERLRLAREVVGEWTGSRWHEEGFE